MVSFVVMWVSPPLADGVAAATGPSCSCPAPAVVKKLSPDKSIADGGSENALAPGSSVPTLQRRRTAWRQRVKTALTPIDFARRARSLYGDHEAVVDGSLRFTYAE